jgi:hypothetical protein
MSTHQRVNVKECAHMNNIPAVHLTQAHRKHPEKSACCCFIESTVASSLARLKEASQVTSVTILEYEVVSYN